MKTLLFLLILISIFGYSQPPKNYNDYNSQYSQDRRDGQKNLEKQADLNRQPNTRNKKTTISNGYSPSYNVTPKALTPEEEREIKLKQEAREKSKTKQKKFDDEYDENFRKEKSKFTSDAKSTYDLLVSFGLTKLEATKISAAYVRSFTGQYKIDKEQASKMVNSSQNKIYFEKNIASGNYDSLYVNLSNLAEFHGSITAQKLLPAFRKRFPSKNVEADEIQFKIFQNYFIYYANVGNSTADHYSGLNKEFIDAYIIFENKNPKIYYALKDSLAKELSAPTPYEHVYTMTESLMECYSCDGKSKRDAKKTNKEFKEREKEIKKMGRL